MNSPNNLQNPQLPFLKDPPLVPSGPQAWGWINTGPAKSLQSCPTLCNPIDGSPPGSTVPGVFQARTLERVAISFSSAWKWKGKVKWLSRVRLLATPWSAAYQAPPSVGFSRQEYWTGCHCLLRILDLLPMKECTRECWPISSSVSQVTMRVLWWRAWVGESTLTLRVV